MGERTRFALVVGLAGLLIWGVWTGFASRPATAAEHVVTTDDGLSVTLSGAGDVTASGQSYRIHLPLVVANWRQPWPTPTPTPPSDAIILADGPGGLELVSAPARISITVGHVTYLPVEVQGYHRPISVTARTLIHTYVNDVTPSEPGTSSRFDVGVLNGPAGELKLQSLRTRPHPLALTFHPETSPPVSISISISISPAIQPRAPLFGTHPPPLLDVIPLPYNPIWGPACGACPTTPGDPPGSTRDVACAKRVADTCNCHPIQLSPDVRPGTEEIIRQDVTQMQRYATQFIRSVGGWGSIQTEPGTYNWTGLDWVFDSLWPEERDFSPLFTGIMSGDFGWMTCPEYTNPDGSAGFFDPANDFVMEQYQTYVRDVTARYAPELRFIETANEPTYGFYLCPCLDPGGPPCDATSGPNQPACLLGHDSEEFVQVYGPFLSAAANAASESMAAANPEAVLIAGGLEITGKGLIATTRYMLEHDLLEHDNVAIMIHQFPYPYPNWLAEPPNCGYFQMPGDPWWLPPGCETAPPFEDYTTPAGRPIAAREMWQRLDEAVDVSEILHDVEEMGILDRFYLFDTELHAGFHDSLGQQPNTTTTPGREGVAGLRIGAINAHQRFVGMELIFAPAVPTPYNLLLRHLAGATPIYAWDAPLTGADYSGLVYKLFTRGDEDILALWSNAEAPLELALTPTSNPTRFRQVTLTSFADAGGPLTITTTDLEAPPATIPVQPLTEFYFLSVISDRPGFGWLAGVAIHETQQGVSHE